MDKRTAITTWVEIMGNTIATLDDNESLTTFFIKDTVVVGFHKKRYGKGQHSNLPQDLIDWKEEQEAM